MIENLVSLSSIFVGLIGVVVTMVMCLTSRSNILVTPFLIIFFGIVVIRLLKQGIFGVDSPNTLPHDYEWLRFLFLIGIPSLYLYFKSFYLDYTYFRYKTLLHFIFPVVFSLVVFAQGLSHYSENVIANTIKHGIASFFIIYYFVLISIFLYPRLWEKNGQSLTSKEHAILIGQWVRFFFILIIVLFVRILFVIYGRLYHLPLAGTYFLILMGNILWLIAFIKILISPEILYGYPILEMRISKYNGELATQDLSSSVWILNAAEITNVQDAKLNNLVDDRLKSYLLDIENFTITKNPFRNPNFTLTEMGKELNIPTSHLSYIFKYHSTLKFVEYKKYARIKDSVQLIQDSFLDTHTLEALASATGFSSYNSFFVAFKKELGYAPKEFLLLQNTDLKDSI